MLDPAFITRTQPGIVRGITVKQMRHCLLGMPDDMVLVVEGDRLIEPHVITDVLPPEPLEGNSRTMAATTVMLSIGGVWKAAEELVD